MSGVHGAVDQGSIFIHGPAIVRVRIQSLIITLSSHVLSCLSEEHLHPGSIVLSALQVAGSRFTVAGPTKEPPWVSGVVRKRGHRPL